MAEPACAEPRYTAFLSYSHKDSAAAARIHRRLESYRLPKRLVGQQADLGHVPPRLWPIFRDRDEMAASTDLSETVRAALEQSAALIVLCSPAAAASRWVVKEIETFRALYPERPILAAIVAGEPPDCFPAPLRPAGADGAAREPVAADLRREGDGPRLGLLKLVAGLTGVGLGDLLQRDATRRVRRVTVVTGIAIAAMLIMAVLTAVALGARREADRQRAEAEGLIEFMLTDLRDRLRAVGRLDALAAVNERALSYYGSQGELRGLPSDSLGRRARILQAIGDDNLTRHRYDAALLAFRQAYQTTAELLARAPGDASRIFDHAKSELGLGRVYEEREDWPRALHHFTRFEAAADRLTHIAPDNPDYLMKAGGSAVDIGNIQLNGSRDYVGAQHSYERAIAQYSRAARARPGDLHVILALANAHGWLADSFYVRRMWRQSLDTRLRQHELVESAYRQDPRNAELGFHLAAADRGVALSHFKLNDTSVARDRLVQAFILADCIAGIEPDNAEWQLLRRLLLSDFAAMHLARPASAPSMTAQRAAAGECR
jgi:tetratricopeptide (TPR) repeat protein